jgi:predicted MPP superfamily phosphohydrolase
LTSGLVLIYVLGRLVAPLPWGRKAKIALGLGLALLSQYHLGLRMLGLIFAAEWPWPVLAGVSWLFLTFTLLLPLLLARDLGRLVWGLARRAWLPRPTGREAAAVAGLALLLAAYGLYEAVIPPMVTRQEVFLANLPPEWDGLTIVQISDLHASPLLTGPRVQRVVELANAEKPNLIVLTGDIIDGSVARRARDVAPLRDLRATHGVYGCPGNHEYYSGYQDWMAALADLGLVMLRNSHLRLEKNDRPLVLAGVTDEAARRYHLPGPDFQAALAGSPREATRILLAHRPDLAPAAALAGFDLQLSGHTHGGQLSILKPLTGLRNGGFVSGWYNLGALQLYTSAGAGLWNGFPIRLGVPSEIVSLVVRSGRPK